MSEKKETAKKETKTKAKKITGKVNVRLLNVRKEPSFDAEILGTVTEGTVLTVQNTKDGWCKTPEGYVKQEYITI